MTKKFDYSTPFASSKTGTRGISFEANRGTWVAKISYKGERSTIGRFATQEEAQAAYNKVAETIRIRAERDAQERVSVRVQNILDGYS